MIVRPMSYAAKSIKFAEIIKTMKRAYKLCRKHGLVIGI